MSDSPHSLTGHDFTPAARRAVADARRRAAVQDRGAVGTEHLLLALTENPDPTIAAVLTGLGLDSSRIRAAVAGLDDAAVPREKISRRGHGGEGAALTDGVTRALTVAMDEARALGDSHVGAEHLLLALRVADAGRAAHALRSLGVSHARLQHVTRELQNVRTRGAGTTHQGASFHVVIDDTSSQSIHEQIVARIREGIATAALRPGDRLPTVRQLADTLDVAPGTVARAYAELERTGAIVTEGTRGTRVAERGPSSASRADLHVALVGLLRPVAVAAFHLGAVAEDLHTALTEAMRDIFPPTA